MAENKTRPKSTSVAAFLKRVQDRRLQEDCLSIVGMMESISKLKPVMWGSAIIGFGSYHYVYESGREGDTMIVGFSPRAQYIAFYLRGGLDPLRDELARLGKYTTGKGCLYIKSLEDVDVVVLKQLLSKAYKGKTGS